MKTINVIYKVLASLCMVMFLVFMGITSMWVLFDSSRTWMIEMSFQLRLVLFIGTLIVCGSAILVDYLRLEKYNQL